MQSTANVEPIKRWETIKRRAVVHLKSLARKEADMKSLIISQLSEVVTQLEETFPLNKQDAYIYEQSKMELEEKLIERTRSALFRSKAKWYEEGGKNTKYFLSLEKSRSCARVCHAVLKENGALVEQPEQVLSEQKSFYQQLYTADKSVKFDMINNTSVKVSARDREILNRNIQMSEVHKAITGMKKGRTPGPDGLPIEFYQAVWPDIKEVLYNSYVQSYEKMSMNPSAMEGILNLIPKKNKDTRLLKNLRPITLLNVDYKIIEKVIANRIKTVLPQIINEDQAGFMSGRRMTVNVRKTMDLLRYTKIKNSSHLLHNLDFLKAFDRAEVSSVLKSLEFFQFPEYIVTWVNTLYKNFTVKIQNNGHFSSDIKVERSVHQGGCASAFLFNILAETMAIHLRFKLEKYAIHTTDAAFLLSQYADDTGAFTENSQQGVTNLYEQIEYFSQQSGLSINYDKTSIYRLGSLKNSQAKLYTAKQITWSNEPVDMLGVLIAYDSPEYNNIAINIDPIMQKSESIFTKWSKRNLSLYGKITVINSLIASLFVHKLYVLPLLPDAYINTFEQMCIKFLWNANKPKIKLSQLQQTKNHAGAGLIDLRLKEIA